MKHIVIICLLMAGCGHSHIKGPICRDGDYHERAGRPAMIQSTEPQSTLRVVVKGQPHAIVLSDENLDALECSISYYRKRYGYPTRDNHQSCGDNH